MYIISRLFSRNKKEKDKKEILVNTLKIITKSSGSHYFSIRPWSGNKKVKPWLNFYKWYFGRKSNNFIMRHIDGEDLFKRSEIVYFSIRISKEYVEA